MGKNTIIQSYDHVEFSDANGNYVMSIQILAEVWKRQEDGSTWKVMSDYVMVKPSAEHRTAPTPKRNKSSSTKSSSRGSRKTIASKSFNAAATKWVTEFNGSKDVEVLSTEHHSIAAYTTNAVFSVSNPSAGAHMNAIGLDSIQQQWKAIRGSARQITKAEGRNVTTVDKNTIIQSYDHVEFSDANGNYVMSIQILAEVWKRQDDGSTWKVMSDY